ncbi:ABC transporter ATP-binding protein [Arcobacter sp. CECT 8985]|uniref:ABC transporter ATP-binding protein n=1 Tax=Arcobacter sp. CECT 8985 TaxID=1935424 RepID=UPI0013E99E12|nr:ABC transporter ATP-binding protein [Arcobacter sp. CECT 8985]
MKKDIAVSLQNISKVYKLYDKPIDRLKESLNPFKKKYHKEFYALRNINLEIKKGEVLGIVGVNGAGKSTLLKIISGVLTPTNGRVNIHGRINAILELGSSLKPEMTGRENIKLNLQLNEIEKNREKITEEIIEFADIGEHIDQPVKSYSSGMKARLGFGIATSTNPDILIVDEVLAVGDVLFQRKCYAKIEKLFKDGKTVIFVSHNAQSVVEFCTRAVLLYDREIILDDTPKKVTDYYQKLVFSKNHSSILKELNNIDKIVDNSKVKILQLAKNKLSNESKFKKSKNYIEGLKCNPQVSGDSEIILKDFFILDTQNYIVNVLKTGQNYKLYVEAELDKDYQNLSFGISFLNVQGTHLSCIREYLKDRINIYNRKIKFYLNFKCNFLHGKYFIKIQFSENEKSLYINHDCSIFQIEKEKHKFQEKMCIVDIEPRIEKIINMEE